MCFYFSLEEKFFFSFSTLSSPLNFTKIGKTHERALRTFRPYSFLRSISVAVSEIFNFISLNLHNASPVMSRMFQPTIIPCNLRMKNILTIPKVSTVSTDIKVSERPLLCSQVTRLGSAQSLYK